MPKKPKKKTHEDLEESREKLRVSDKDMFLSHKERRYALFRVQNYLNGGSMPEPEHLKYAKDLEEEIEPLGGVLQFAIVWDVDAADGSVVLRDRSVWKAHEQYMEKAARKLAPIGSKK